MKAVKCPICNGTGEKEPHPNYSSNKVTCNGCNGKGWVEVAESYQDYKFADLNAVKGIK
jgi:DnaJ-class molecular chaperone